MIGLPVSSYSSASTFDSLLNAGSAPVFRLTPEASPFPNPLPPVLEPSDAEMAFTFGFFGAGSIALKPPNDEPPPRRALMRPGFERSTTFWKAGFADGFATTFGAGGASPSDSESEYPASRFMVVLARSLRGGCLAQEFRKLTMRSLHARRDKGRCQARVQGTHSHPHMLHYICPLWLHDTLSAGLSIPFYYETMTP